MNDDRFFCGKKRVEEEVRKRCEKWAPTKAVKDKPLQSVWKKKLLRDRKILAIEAEITHSVQRQNQLEQVNNKFLGIKKQLDGTYLLHGWLISFYWQKVSKQRFFTAVGNVAQNRVGWRQQAHIPWVTGMGASSSNHHQKQSITIRCGLAGLVRKAGESTKKWTISSANLRYKLF